MDEFLFVLILHSLNLFLNFKMKVFPLNEKYLQVIFYLFLFTSLFATQEDNEDKPSYHKGRIIADLSFGSLHSEISNRSNLNTLTALYFLYDVRPLLLSSTSRV